MEYNHETRSKLYENFLLSWRKKMWLAGEKTKKLVEKVEKLQGYSPDRSLIEEAKEKYRKAPEVLLSDFMKKEYKGLVQAFVGKAYQEDFYHIIDRINRFPYARGLYRRTVRANVYLPFLEEAFTLMLDYRTLDFYGGSLEKYIKNDLSLELLDMKNVTGRSTERARFSHLDYMIAARMDAGDEFFIEMIKDMILSDNNTAILTVEVIRGIVESTNSQLHKLLADFLVAARLQEGVRQAICENADCGTVEAFLTIFDTICENNLIRFAAVKRAVATWTGLGGFEDPDRITAKVVEDIRAGVDSVEKAYEFVASNDSIHIMVGLWSIGFRDVTDAIKVMQGYLERGSKNQLLTMSYYNRQLAYGTFSHMVAKEMIKRYAKTGELEYIAAFMVSYLGDVNSLMNNAYRYTKDKNGNNQITYYKIEVKDYFDHKEEAKEHYEYLKQVLQIMPKKKIEFSPCIFPWYQVSLSKSDLVKCMACIAYMLEEPALMYEVAGLLEFIDSSSYPSRGTFVRLLLHDLQTKDGTDCLVKLLADKETTARDMAFELLKERSLTEMQYRELEGYLKYKNKDIRSHVLTILLKQEEGALKESVVRLLADSGEEIREGGLSLVLAARKEKKAQEALVQVVEDFAGQREQITEREKILVEEITGGTKTQEILSQKGYGLYNPEAEIRFPIEDYEEAYVKRYFDVSPKKIDGILEKLEKIFEENSHREYKSAYGEMVLLGNRFGTITYDRSIPLAEQYPFRELWVDFYEKEIGNPDLLNLLMMAVYSKTSHKPEEIWKEQQKFMGRIADYNKAYVPKETRFGKDYILVFQILQSIYGNGDLKRVGLEVIKYMLTQIPEDQRWHAVLIPATTYQSAYEEKHSMPKDLLTGYLLTAARGWNTEEEFREYFALFYELDKAFAFNEVARSEKRPYYYASDSTSNFLSIWDYMKAYNLNMIAKDILYQAIFETYGLKSSFAQLGYIYRDKLHPLAKSYMKKFLTPEEMENGKIEENSTLFKMTDEIYQSIIDRILEVELHRGEMATVFSDSVMKIEKFFGAHRLVQILVALGKEKLNRGRYYGYREKQVSRQESFSHLLKTCYPLPTDNADILRELMKKSKVTPQRLIEVAMYAPQWMDICEEYLGYSGFKSGCYYFMAHMNESFDDRRKAVIAKYTPLTIEELNQGAFDVDWFEESYEKLGEVVFNKIYDAAKYISDGSKHARARKYADAALGKVTMESLETEITQKRNKDLLMSYPLTPFSGKEELVHRYEFIKKFEKESKQFGAQRKASEAAAAQMALRNLATKAGYPDVTRLTLAMETEIVKTYGSYFAWQQVGEVKVKIQVDEFGRAEILCEKNDKPLKSIPASLKKDETILAVKEVQKKLKEQYLRTVAMLENAMETYEVFYFEELQKLCENPVTEAIVKSLVFVTEDGKQFGFLGEATKGTSRELVGEALKEASGKGIEECSCIDSKGVGEATGIAFKSMEGLQDTSGLITPLSPDCKLMVAHAFHLYQAGVWSEYQAYFYKQAKEDIVRKQPFKQVFRELYVKLPEEMDKLDSRMFAGNQIQPSKTVACLKGRKWVADCEDGLQKIYYKQNIIARIYALADWFSPSDIEAPTLEWVEFSDRKTFRPIAIKDVPDVIYSEVMRDVDLAVSVAHAGGVDPQTSHSTIEMRRVIVSFNLPLFGLTNVTLEKNHAIIQGKLAKYSVHLGSGVIHQMGSHQINVLPVHSQSRGKLFLPFIDEDPKTAEIMSKIVLFAKDEKIKDPYILEQIRM